MLQPDVFERLCARFGILMGLPLGLTNSFQNTYLGNQTRRLFVLMFFFLLLGLTHVLFPSFQFGVPGPSMASAAKDHHLASISALDHSSLVSSAVGTSDCGPSTSVQGLPLFTTRPHGVTPSSIQTDSSSSKVIGQAPQQHRLSQSVTDRLLHSWWDSTTLLQYRAYIQ